MKKATILLLVILFVLQLAGCGKKDSYELLEQAQREAEAAATAEAAEAAAAAEKAAEPLPQPMPEPQELWQQAEALEEKAAALDYEEAQTVTKTAGKSVKADSLRIHRIEIDRQNDPACYFLCSGDVPYEVCLSEGAGYLGIGGKLWKCEGDGTPAQVAACMEIPTLGTGFMEYFTDFTVEEQPEGYHVSCSGASAELDRAVRTLFFPNAESFAIRDAEGSVQFTSGGAYAELTYRMTASVTEGGTVFEAEAEFRRTYSNAMPSGLPGLAESRDAEKTEDLRIPLLLEQMLAAPDANVAGTFQEGLLFDGSLQDTPISASQVSLLQYDFSAAQPEYRAEIALTSNFSGSEVTTAVISEYRDGTLYSNFADGTTGKSVLSAEDLKQTTRESITALCGRSSLGFYSDFRLREEEDRTLLEFTADDSMLINLLATGLETGAAGSSGCIVDFTAWQGEDCTGRYEFRTETGEPLRFMITTGLQTLTLADGTVLECQTVYELLFE